MKKKKPKTRKRMRCKIEANLQWDGEYVNAVGTQGETVQEAVENLFLMLNRLRDRAEEIIAADEKV